jgi:CNT family concentrative nucleoside transporter
MLVVFVALTWMIDAGLSWFGSAALGASLSLERILGWLFSPLAWLMGVPSGDVERVGGLLGSKTVLTEMYSYSRMSEMLRADPTWLSERGRLIASYALCGFANLASIGIQIGGYTSLAPERRADISRTALRAMIAGTLATCMVACVAGLFL